MKRKLSILVSLLLLLTLTVGSFFYYAYLGVSDVAVKIQSHISLAHKNSDELGTIKLAAKDFNKHADEIWYKGHLYDVASSRVKGDSVEVSVLYDENEEVLVSVIKEHFCQSFDPLFNNSNKHFSSKHSTNPNDIKCIPDRIVLQRYYFSLTSCFNDLHNEYTSVRSPEIIAPPPKA